MDQQLIEPCNKETAALEIKKNHQIHLSLQALGLVSKSKAGE